VRTALAITAGGVALQALGLPDTSWLRTTLAVSLVLLGGLVTVFAMIRWARVERAMRERTALPAFQLGFLLTGAIIVGVVLIALALA
jgi:putative membrane protein